MSAEQLTLVVALLLWTHWAWLIAHRRRLWRERVYIPLTLGSKVVDLQPGMTDTVHTAIGGISGTGKSTTVLPLFDVPVGVLCIALDNTRPIAAKVRSLDDGIEWSNEPGSPGWGIGLDILRGTPQIVSEALVAGWTARSTGDTGKYRNIARLRLWAILEQLDAAGEQRTLEALWSKMMIVGDSTESRRACQDWAERIGRLVKEAGPCFGRDLDLVQAMRRQQKVLLRLNSFLMPDSSPMLGGMMLVHARRAAQEAGVPFVLIVEEAGQLKHYSDQITPLSQAGRDRGVPLVLLTQNMSLLPHEVINNTSVWVSFAQESRAELAFAAERLRIEPEMLHRENFRNNGRGWAYIRSPEISTALVKIKQHTPKKPPATPSVALSNHVPPSVTPDVAPWDEDEILDIAPEPLSLPQTASLAIPAWVTTSDRLKVWQRLERATAPSVQWHPDRGFWTGTPCLLWQGNPKATRPQVRIGDNTLTVYRVVWEWIVGEIPESFTIDHLCGTPRCCDTEHLEVVSNEENIRRRTARQKASSLLGVA